ncbi:hypothetical protein MUGA111182_17225 [Mucilaginibacter galii]|uniref:Uncharacterized protein n=1 Tax=Mucilaginibacter galii TaxID=2005073 RepID=A0A917J6W1_9SPHI|nr:hypothetical protein [Mucilaginibacter galii]GGI49764.1 hypothetical protein GCM10011425_09760 [Mucilaginibacter galii]
MPNEKVKTTEDKETEKLQTEAPIDERDEVKQAEERTRKLQEDAKTASIHHGNDQPSED